jgi:hypothetical protein
MDGCNYGMSQNWRGEKTLKVIRRFYYNNFKNGTRTKGSFQNSKA